MNYVLQQIVDGLASGAIYASLGLALVFSYRATGIVNFSQGAMGVVGAYLAWALWSIGTPTVLAVLAAMVLSFVLGAGTERLLIRRLHRQNELVTIIITVGLLILLTGAVGLIFGNDPRQFPALFPDVVVRAGGVAISAQALGTILIVAVVVVAMQLVLTRSRFGLSLRAVADNRDSSALVGLPIGPLLMGGWGIAAMLGTLSATLLAGRVLLSPTFMDSVLVYALTAAVLGGLASPLGTVLAALLIGVVSNVAGAYVPIIGNDLKIAIPLVLMALVLVLRPEGLFGRRGLVRV
jgi:branched-chain amino acid transport system permease protein